MTATDPTPGAPPITCPNCGTLVTDQYCPRCGQQRADVRISVRRLARDVLEDQLSVNSALPRTMRALFLHPGRLTNEYLAGRIASYIPPFRLYLISSLLFFVLLSFISRSQRVELTDPDLEMTPGDSVAAVASPQGFGSDSLGAFMRIWKLRIGIKPHRKTLSDAIEMHLGSKRLEDALRARLHALDRLPPQEAAQRLLRSLIQQAPKVVFLLLPVYAFLLQLLYLSGKRYYVEHFVFALHVHAFVFLIFFLMLVLGRNLYVVAPLVLWLPAYAFIAMKRVYGQGWIKTFLKWSALGFAYLFLFAFALFFTFIAAVFTL